ncbi:MULTISPECIES: LAETG motif-containing sortase-dependent surface protein [Streptomyces]|uniref:LAETG motif-containing sortase-dependent surface protein n=1 Tax=Streptomyces ramulosus TaxID=47762 RepID=A0ABW1FMU8_9ACTN
MNLFRTAPTQSAPTARRIRGAASAGLLAACALTTLAAAGPAFADDSAPASTRPSPSVSVPSDQRPTAVPSSPGHDRTRPSAEPTLPPGGERGSDTPRPVPSVSRPGEASRGDGATPAPATGRDASGKDELAHTGASETTTLIMGAGAAALLVAGGGTLYAVRRNRA